MKATQQKFAERLAVDCGVTASPGKRIVDSFEAIIYKHSAVGDKIELSGLGTFSVSHRAPRIGFNPRTRKAITIPELNTARFIAGEAFKQAVDCLVLEVPTRASDSAILGLLLGGPTISQP